MDRSQLLRGALDAAVLAVVADRTGTATTSSAACVRAGSRRRRRLRLRHPAPAVPRRRLTSYVVPSDEGPHRRYYGITDRGREQLAEARVSWRDFARALDAILETDVEVPA